MNNKYRGAASYDLIHAVVPTLPILLLYVAILIRTGGHFTYTLDDPYIHLALAKNIMAGNYGINLTEPSAPSSSIIWPFLLAPFSKLPALFESTPLLINILCLLGSAFLLNGLLPKAGTRMGLAMTTAFLLAFNFYGLVMTGMEHNLQLLLVLVLARGVIKGDEGLGTATQRAAFYLSLALLPLVRYEGMAISLPVAAYMTLARGDGRRAVPALLVALAGMVAFSLYLHAQGLGFLPSSVMAKSSVTGLRAIAYNVYFNIEQYGWFAVLVIVYGAWCWKTDKALAALLASATLLHFTFGRHGWYGRYEVYYVVFVLVFVIRDLAAHFEKTRTYVLLLPLCFPSLVYATATSPLAASNIFNQQAQMATIAHALGEKVAVNDLGLVALRGGHYVLDLWGLGSIEALKARMTSKNTLWIGEVMKQKGVHYAIIYDAWFPQKPADWIKVGQLKLTEPTITPGSDTVVFYATTPDAAQRLRQVMTQFRSQDPARHHTLSID